MSDIYDQIETLEQTVAWLKRETVSIRPLWKEALETNNTAEINRLSKIIKELKGRLYVAERLNHKLFESLI